MGRLVYSTYATVYHNVARVDIIAGMTVGAVNVLGQFVGKIDIVFFGKVWIVSMADAARVPVNPETDIINLIRMAFNTELCRRCGLSSGCRVEV